MRLDDHLAARLGTTQEEVGESLLHCRVKVKFWLFKKDQGRRLRQEAHQQNRKYLADTDADSSEVELAIQRQRLDAHLYPGSAQVFRTDGLGKTEVGDPARERLA